MEYASDWLEPVEQYIATLDEQRSHRLVKPVEGAIAQRCSTWWTEHIVDPTRPNAPPRKVEVQDLVFAALQHSHFVIAISETPIIEDTRIVEADAAFDWRTFMSTRWDDTSDPVGSLLTTGGSPRFRDHRWHYTAGLRRLNRHGGRVDVSQRIGFQDNNSVFFVPKEQGTAKLAFSFTQPLLNGAGQTYNSRLIVLAQLDRRLADAELAVQLQDHLLQVARAYWDLYQARAVQVQKSHHVDQARQIVKVLEARKEHDALPNQVLHARAAVASRQAELIRAEAATRNAEARIRALVNDPDLRGTEIIPFEEPICAEVDLSLRTSLLEALRQRPDIERAIQEVRTASLRVEIARHELRPVLDFILEGYVAGLQGNSDIPTAVGEQFWVGEPSYSVGFQFEMPLGNRVARARTDRRQLEFSRSLHRLKATAEASLAEVEIAVRDANASLDELESRWESMAAAAAEVEYLSTRWDALGAEQASAGNLLEDLLESQDQLSTAEFEFVRVQVQYAMALVQLKRATGALFQMAQIPPDSDEAKLVTEPDPAPESK